MKNIKKQEIRRNIICQSTGLFEGSDYESQQKSYYVGVVSPQVNASEAVDKFIGSAPSGISRQAVCVLSANAFEFAEKDSGRMIKGITLQTTDSYIVDTPTRKGINIQSVSFSTNQPVQLLNKLELPGFYVLDYVLLNKKKTKIVNMHPFTLIEGQQKTAATPNPNQGQTPSKQRSKRDSSVEGVEGVKS